MLVDSTNFPIVIVRFPERFNADTVKALGVEYDRLFARRQRFVMVCDLRPIGEVPDAVVRKELAAMLNDKEFRERHNAFQLGSANVIASAAMRAGLTALLWLWRPEIPLATVSTLDEGIDWARDRLRATGERLPADRVGS